MKEFRISFVGLGFVGLSMAAAVSQKGFKTTGIDIDEQKIKQLKEGKTPFYEPGLDKCIMNTKKTKNLEFSTKIDSALSSDIIFLCVGTPTKPNGQINLSYVKQASRQLAAKLRNFGKKRKLVVIKSTVIPETTRNEIIPLFDGLISSNKVSVVVNPEFLREGQAINDVLSPHLIVIGEYGKQGTKMLEEFYQELYGKGEVDTIRTDPTTAEMIKYANNAFLATKISFINSLANICQRLPGTDVNVIASAIGKDPRIGPLFLQAGAGFGGSCLPKDISALLTFSKKFKDNSDVLFSAVKKINKQQPQKVLKILEAQGLLKQGNVIAILGLSFKKDTDDIREAVSLEVVRRLLKKKVKIKVHDPMAIKNFKKVFSDKVEYSKSIKDCITNSDACIVLTEWDEYKRLKPSNFIESMKKPNLVDARRIFSPNKFKEKLNYFAIGYGNN